MYVYNSCSVHDLKWEYDLYIYYNTTTVIQKIYTIYKSSQTKAPNLKLNHLPTQTTAFQTTVT